jgi:putative Mn2+ efflux pump MntP
VLALLLVAVSLGLSNLAAAIGIGISGVRGATRVRVGVIFGIFEAGMPVVGLVAGRSLAAALGHEARWIGGALLIGTGAYSVVQALRGEAAPGGGEAAAGDRWSTRRLIVSALALSIDNLAVGFALGTYHVGLALAAAVIGGVSVAMSLAGLELGARIGTVAGRRGELAGGLVLIGVGAAVAAGLL